MRVDFNAARDRVIFSYKDAYEYKFLASFPAFLREGPYFLLPAKQTIVHNVLHRVLKQRKGVEVATSVKEWLDSPFKLKELPPEFSFHTKPKDFQEIALRYLYTMGGGGLLLDPGMGKSKIVLDFIKLMGFKRSFIVCPKSLLFVWEDEIQIHRPELSPYVVKTTSWEDELANGLEEHDVVLLNYNKAVILAYELKKLGADFLHLDEFLIKDNSTQRTQTLTGLSRGIPVKCGGSGTLVNNSILDVYCPVRYLEPALVGGNYNNFFKNHVVTVKNESSGRNMVVAHKGKEVARSILESCSIVMSKERWLKLPPKVFHDIMVPLGPDQKEAYYTLLSNYAAKVGEHVISVDNPLVMVSKLYQIANGFCYVSNDKVDLTELEEVICDEGRPKKKPKKRETITFKDSSKIKALKELITGKLSSRRSLIWYNMDAELDMIQALLDELKMSYLVVNGGTKDTGTIIRRYNNDASIQWLVCQTKAVNYGVTILGKKQSEKDSDDEGIEECLPQLSPEVYTQVFYSLSFSLETYIQQQDRTHRLGQDRECEYYRLFTTSTICRRIRSALEEKMSLRREMLVDIIDSLIQDTQP